jgi:hypothetical protein
MEPLAKLFGSPARLKVLRLFLFNKDATYVQAEVAERTKITKDAARKELTDLTAANILKKRGARTKATFQTNPKFEHLTELDLFIRETTNVRPENVVTALKKAGALRLVALSGLFTGITESQVDLLVVGDNLDERSLAAAVRALEAELGREIRYASFGTADFKYRMRVYDRLLRDVFDYPHRLIIDRIGL